MSTWQIFSDAGNDFRWEESDQQLWREDQSDALTQRTIDTSRLPSMADLLLQGCSKLVENEKGTLKNSPIFRTGLGKSVAVRQSSIAKARSVLGDVDDVFTDAGQLGAEENGYDFLKPMFEMGSLKPAVMLKFGLQNGLEETDNMPNSMFQTGSGKPVNVSSAGLHRAKKLLGIEGNNNHDTLHGFGQTQKQSACTEILGWQSTTCLETRDHSNLRFSGCTEVLTSSFGAKSNSLESGSKEIPDFLHTSSKPPPVKFHTAGGRSISVSSDALQRARSLLGNLDSDSFLNEADTVGSVFPTIDGKAHCSSNKIMDVNTPFPCKGIENGNNSSRNFTSPFRSSSPQKQSVCRSEKLQPGNNLIKKFDAEAETSTSFRHYNGFARNDKPLKNKSELEKIKFSENVRDLENDISKKPSIAALMDITNSINVDHLDKKQYFGEKRRFGRINSVSPFKKPRSSFVTPLNTNNSSVPNGLSTLAPKVPGCNGRILVSYPRQIPRAYIKEYLSHLPSFQLKMEHFPEHVRKMNPSAAEIYTFQNEQVSDGIGPEAFHRMLCQFGASVPYLTKEWVSNHYKWIVWKLASYERCFPAKFCGKLLTVSNVLEELQYRYEREVNHGHRSAIKKILDGDAPPSSMMVLCVSSVGDFDEPRSGPQSVSFERDTNGGAVKIELTDGWYSVKALLDEPLSQKLASGKLFLGQKIRIWGAKLCGWLGPISPLEGSQASCLSLHINGTYRCHWAERLGFCKSVGIPLAFRCIKSTGGTIPCTLVGITRVYPVLYRERLNDGSFTVRSERVEAKVMQLYNQRRSVVADGIISAFQGETKVVDYDHDCEEGAKIMKLLETAAEPEILMAGMSSKQLTSFASYKAKLEAMRQTDMQKSIEKALEAAGLSVREVTPFLRVRVVGLTKKSQSRKDYRCEGLITIWNPTEKQKQELCEGQAYSVGDVVPTSSDSGTLYLQARGSTTNWLPLSSSVMEKFEPFFTPRSSATISSLGEVSLSSEFDIAAFVVYVGEVYTQGHKKKQWVFVTDGCAPEFNSKESLDALLAISFCSSYVECDSFVPVNYNVAGSVVGFCNLIKRPRDQVNGLWVAESTENSDYFLSYNGAGHNHLKDVAASVLKWAKTSSLTIEKLKENVHYMIRQSKKEC